MGFLWGARLGFVISTEIPRSCEAENAETWPRCRAMWKSPGMHQSPSLRRGRGTFAPSPGLGSHRDTAARTWGHRDRGQRLNTFVLALNCPCRALSDFCSTANTSRCVHLPGNAPTPAGQHCRHTRLPTHAYKYGVEPLLGPTFPKPGPNLKVV